MLPFFATGGGYKRSGSASEEPSPPRDQDEKSEPNLVSIVGVLT